MWWGFFSFFLTFKKDLTMKMFLSILLLVFSFAAPSYGALNNERNPNLSIIELGSITADADVYGLYIPKRARILSVYVVDAAGIAASDTNYVQVSLQVGSTVIAELDSRAAHENALVANVPEAANLVSAASLLTAGSYLKVTYNEEGTVAMTTAKVFVEWAPQ